MYGKFAIITLMYIGFEALHGEVSIWFAVIPCAHLRVFVLSLFYYHGVNVLGSETNCPACVTITWADGIENRLGLLNIDVLP